MSVVWLLKLNAVTFVNLNISEHNYSVPEGPFIIERQRQRKVNVMMTLAIVFSLRITEKMELYTPVWGYNPFWRDAIAQLTLIVNGA